MFKKVLIALLLLISLSAVAVALPSSTASAHQSGCHRWHSCPSDTGSYVCGDTGHTSGCGTATPIVKKPTIVHVPVKTSKTESTNSVIRYKTIVKSNTNEYPSYKKVLSAGVDGKNISKTLVQYNDEVEVSRSTPVVTILNNAADETVEVGTRAVPTCKITKVVAMHGGFFGANEGKYVIEGFCAPKIKITLYQNDKKFSSTKSNKDGYFEFKKVRRSNVPSWLVIYDKNDKTKRLSEKTRVTFTQQKIETEYAILHKS